MNAWLPQNAKSELVDLVSDVNTSSILKLLPVCAPAVLVNSPRDTATAASKLTASLIHTTSARWMTYGFGPRPSPPPLVRELGTSVVLPHPAVRALQPTPMLTVGQTSRDR